MINYLPALTALHKISIKAAKTASGERPESSPKIESPNLTTIQVAF
jgi:hypothetical protein